MLRQKIIDGETVLGTMISEIGHPNLLRIMKNGGFEFVIIDGEHGPFDLTQFASMVALGNSIGLDVLIRIPGIDRGMITKLLDMGADGFLVPMVNTVGEAEKLVQYSKYAPLGKRGISTTRAHTNYNPPKLSEYMEQANKKTVLLAQIETAEAVENAERIAAVPGIDVLIVGPSDLSSDLGDPGNLKPEKLLISAEKVAQAARRHGKRSGTVSANLQYLRACQKMGMTVFNKGSELGMLLSGAKQQVKSFWEEETKA